MNRMLVPVLVLLLASCSGGAPQTIDSTQLPGTPIVVFPNSGDRIWSTALLANPRALQSGVGGRSLTVTLFNRQRAVANQITVDFEGNLGVRGTVSSRSTLRSKKDVAPYRPVAALELLRGVGIVSYRYKNESSEQPAHVGFIAERTPSQLSGPRHDSFNLNNSIGVTMAAEQALDAQVRELQAEVRELKEQVRALKARSTR